MEVIESQIIDYPDGPEGKAFVGFAKRPLMATPTGIGFMGVKLQTPDRTEIQCLQCGFYFRFITAKHLATHGLDRFSYKKKFGYTNQVSLVSDRYARACAASVKANGLDKHINRKLTKKDQPFYRNLIRYAWAAREKIKEAKLSASFQNKFGTCPEQLKERFRNHIDRFYKPPGYNPIGKDFGGSNIWAIAKRRFGSVSDIRKEYGLPTPKVAKKVRNGIDWYFSDGTIIQTVKDKDESLKPLYEKIKATSSLYK